MGFRGVSLSEWGLHMADWRAATKGAEKGSKMHVGCSVENWPRPSGGQKGVWVPKSPLQGVFTEQLEDTGRRLSQRGVAVLGNYHRSLAFMFEFFIIRIYSLTTCVVKNILK